MCLPAGLLPVPHPAAPVVSQDDHTDQEAQSRGADQGDGPGHPGRLCGPLPPPRHLGGAGAAEEGQGQGGGCDHRGGGQGDHGHAEGALGDGRVVRAFNVGNSNLPFPRLDNKDALILPATR